MSCPVPVLLSQLADGELAAPEATSVQAHVASCAACAALVGRFGMATTIARPPVPAPSAASAAGCVGSAEIAGWVQRALPPREMAAADAHVRGCDACLDEALAAARMMARLDAAPALAVPATLRARVASRWADVTTPSLTSVVVDLARAGARLLERHLVAPILSVDELPATAGAVRGDESGDAVRFRICAPGAQIHAAVVPAGDVAGLTLTLTSEGGEALAGQRVFVRRQGRSIFSARTDDDGALRVQRIEIGVYEVSCPGIGTSFRLDLRR